MIDNIKIVSEGDYFLDVKEDSLKGQYIWNNLYFDPIIKNGKIVSYCSEVDNFRLIISPKRLILTGSIHKYSNGNNYSDFPFSKIEKAVNSLEEKLRIPANLLRVIRIEFGLNIAIKSSSMKFIETLESLKGKILERMLHDGKKYGIIVYFKEYSFKIYDKKWQVNQASNKNINLPFELLRVEVQYKRGRRFRAVRTLADLINKNSLQILYEEIIKLINLLIYKCSADPLILTLGDYKLWSAGQHPEFWNARKIKSLQGYRKDIRKYREICNTISGESGKVLCELVKTKYAELICS